MLAGRISVKLTILIRPPAHRHMAAIIDEDGESR
jgi:hypothetical protein